LNGHTNQAVGSDSELLVLDMLLTVKSFSFCSCQCGTASSGARWCGTCCSRRTAWTSTSSTTPPGGRRAEADPDRHRPTTGPHLLPRGGDLPCPDLIVRSMHVWWLVGVLDRCWSEFPGTCRDRRSRLGDVLLYIISYYAMAPACSLWVAVCLPACLSVMLFDQEGPH